MSMKSGFFDSTYIVEEVGGYPRGNKAVDAAFVAAIDKNFYSDGISRGETTFKVTCDGASGTTVTIGAGFGFIQGYKCYDDSSSTLDLGFDASNDRTVVVALRLDRYTSASSSIYIQKIVNPGATPTHSSTDYWDLWLARVTIPAGTVNITQAMIQDLRSNTTYCGWILAPLVTVDADAFPEYIKDGATRIATATGGTAAALTATVPDFDELYDVGVQIRIFPTVNISDDATISVNGGSAKMIYSISGNRIKSGQVMAGTPLELIWHDGKYFFNLTGMDGEIEPGDVCFWNTDGTLYYTYSNSSIAGLSSLPTVPGKENLGLVSDGWNWTLADLKSHVQHCPYGTVDVGPHYKFADGGTSVWVDMSQGGKTLGFWMTLSGASSTAGVGVTIDWGDGNTESMYSGGSKYHTYSSNGIYEVHITNDTGVTYLPDDWSVSPDTSGSSSHGYPRIKRIVIGEGYNLTTTTSQYNNLFYDVSSMYELISAKDKTAANADIFLSKYVICGIVPRTITTSSATPAIRDAASLPEREYTICLPYTFSTAFGYAVATRRLCVPYGGNFTTWSISDAYWCEKFGVPDTVTTLTVPKGVYLTEFVVPSSVTAITSSASGSVSNRSGLTKLKFLGTTPPTAASQLYIPSSCVIAVPTGYLATYQAATNYPDPTSYTYIEED